MHWCKTDVGLVRLTKLSIYSFTFILHIKSSWKIALSYISIPAVIQPSLEPAKMPFAGLQGAFSQYNTASG